MVPGRLPRVDDALERAQRLVERYDEELRRLLPEGADIFDAHTHLGHDIDGMRGLYEELDRNLERYGVSRCFMFCMDERDREPAFRKPNDRTLEHARRSGGRMIPFVRLDLAADPIEEAERCLDLGARGIKLHPRAQRFLLNDERLDPIFALAAERRVPILIHGGRGLPPIADALARLVDAHPERAADHRPRRDRRPREPDGALRRPRRGLLRHLGLEPDRPARPLPARRRPSRSSTPPTTRTASSPPRSSSRSRRRGSPGSTRTTCATCSPATRTGSPTASRRSSRVRRRAPRRSSSR